MSDRFTLGVAFTSTLLVWITAAGISVGAEQARPAAAAAQAPVAAAANQYVGESTCVTCHDQKYVGTPHGLKSNPRTPASAMGCESCHGPGKAHVDAGGDVTRIVNFKTMSRQESSALCVTCHDVTKTHAHPIQGPAKDPRDGKELRCTSCHNPHSSTEEHLLTKEKKRALCVQCHLGPNLEVRGRGGP